MKIAQKRKAGELLERGGISQRIITIATEISQGTYKEAIEKAGQIAELVDAASFDDYWSQKVLAGKHREQCVFHDLLEGALSKDRVICETNPYQT